MPNNFFALAGLVLRGEGEGEGILCFYFFFHQS